MLKSYPLLLFTLLAPAASLSAQQDKQPQLPLLNKLLKNPDITIQAQRHNNDLPYVISVLSAEQLQRLGIHNLREALSLIPGLDLSIGPQGIKSLVFRGSNPFALGQSRLMIDGVVVNDSLFASYDQYLDMPTQIIQRIEILRGPISFSSHVTAYAGSIQVITKANRNDGMSTADDVFLSAGSHSSKLAGFVSEHRQGDFRVSTDLFYQLHELMLPVEADVFANAGDTDHGIENYQFGINANNRNFSLKSRFARNDLGIGYGQSFYFSEDPGDFMDITNNFIEASYQSHLSDKLKLQYFLGYFDESRNLQNKLLPDGSTISIPAPPVFLPNGRYFLADYSERRFSERIELTIRSFESHDITMGIYAYQSKVNNNIAMISDDNLSTFTAFDLLQNNNRNLISLYIDDLVSLNEKVSIQLGLKLDDYSDVDHQVSPKLGYVYRHNEQNIFRLMYTAAYREPSWTEQYLNTQSLFAANLQIEAQTVDALEASYSHQLGLSSYYNVNLFYMSQKDQIHAQNTNTFHNSGDGELYGLEAEYKTVVFTRHPLYLNYAYVDGSNVDNVLANSAQHMFKGYYTQQLNQDYSLSGIFRYIDEKHRIETDSRLPVEGYGVLDLTLAYQPPGAGLLVTASIKNVFDKDYYLPSPNNTYPGDFLQDGRSLQLSLEMEF